MPPYVWASIGTGFSMFGADGGEELASVLPLCRWLGYKHPDGEIGPVIGWTYIVHHPDHPVCRDACSSTQAMIEAEDCLISMLAS